MNHCPRRSRTARIRTNERPSLFAILVLLLCLPLAAQAPLPQPTGFINDYAGVLKPGVVQQLEAIAVELKQKTKAEVAVAVIKSLEGDSIESYANVLAEEWGVGDAEDRGALLLLSIEDRRMRIEVGYGLEPILPDGRAGEIREQIRPALQAGDYDRAVAIGFLGIAQIVAADAGVSLTGVAASQRRTPRRRRSRGILGLWPLIFFLPFLFARRRGRGGWHGGAMTSAWMLGGLAGMGRGGYSGMGGGGFSSGGFGGFSGGGFGGGGASGSW